MIIVDRKYRQSLGGISYIDLFSGIGAFHLAMDSFGAQCVFASEIDEACREVYKVNHAHLPVGDITKVRVRDIPEFDILCAGFPCQSFTIAGTQRGFDDPRGQLFFEICRIAKSHRPPLMILENVPNLLSHDQGNTFKVVLDSLDGLGYDVNYKVLNASNYGVPQARRRIYVVCTQRGMLNGFEFPKPIAKDLVLSDVLLSADETARWNVALEGRRPQLDRSPVARCHRTIQVGQVNNGGMGQRIYHPNGHAITLTKSGGSCGSKTGLYLVGDVVRRLAPRECARLSGFPESFVLHRSAAQAQMQFGNTIVVDVLQHIVKSLVEQRALGLSIAA